MVRYYLSPSDWRGLIDEVAPTFLARAAERTERFRAAGRYDEDRGIWSEVKRAYMRLQGFKCGFCERRLEKSIFGNVEHDVEHFRPKSSVTAWPTDSIRESRGLVFDFPLGAAADPGYFLLAYHIENYLISCKTCNTALKSNYFPIADTVRLTAGAAPRDLRAERPYLLYPIGAVDVDPETVITFRGTLPMPVQGISAARRRRAEVTIDFFALDAREVLLEERAEVIVTLHVALHAGGHPEPSVRAAADLLVTRMTDIRSPHANCARAHHDLFLAEPAIATEFAEAALGYLDSL